MRIIMNNFARKIEEPSLDELLAAGPVRQVMEADNVNADALRSAVQAILDQRAGKSSTVHSR